MRRRGTHSRGSALMVVLIVLAVLTTLAVANSVFLHHLQKELRQIEHQQTHRWQGMVAR